MPRYRASLVRLMLVISSARRPDCANPTNAKHVYHIYTMLVQRRRRLADVVSMCYTSVLCLLGGVLSAT